MQNWQKAQGLVRDLEDNTLEYLHLGNLKLPDAGAALAANHVELSIWGKEVKVGETKYVFLGPVKIHRGQARNLSFLFCSPPPAPLSVFF